MTNALLRAVVKIAKYQRGGTVIRGECTGDRDEMIGAARQALVQFTGEPNVQAAIEASERRLSQRRAA